MSDAVAVPSLMMMTSGFRATACEAQTHRHIHVDTATFACDNFFLKPEDFENKKNSSMSDCSDKIKSDIRNSDMKTILPVPRTFLYPSSTSTVHCPIYYHYSCSEKRTRQQADLPCQGCKRPPHDTRAATGRQEAGNHCQRLCPHDDQPRRHQGEII